MSLTIIQLKMKPYWFLLVTITLLTMQTGIARPATYYDYKSLRKHLVSLAKQDPNLVRVDSIAQSIDKRKVWVVEVGKGAEDNRKKRPSILVLAGIEGNDLTGSSIAVSWLEQLIKQFRTDHKITELLETTTIYVIPRLNPDAAEHFFIEPKFETSANNKPVDADHDGLMDEDGPEDLNEDGLITWMRVEDKEGDYILDPVDKRLLLKADNLKGEVGAWRYLSEGIDNDHDEEWNEDGLGGVNFNRNFPYNYEFFASDAGVHQVSEAQTRALAEFVIEHPNIGIIITYGAADNLLKTPESAPDPDRRKPMISIDEKDLGYYKVMGEIYREAIGLNKELENTSCPGTFSDWMYFHRGRLSLASRPWSPSVAVEISKSAEEEEKDEQEKTGDNDEKKKNADYKKDKDKRNENERKELKWFDEHAPRAFIKWQSIEHPDFPGRNVEIGGYAPYSLTNPPANMVEEVVGRHTDFLTTVIQRLPRIGIRRVETKHLGQGTYDIEIHVENTGFLPTSLAQGQTTREVYPTRLVMDLDDEHFLSGTRITTLPVIPGSGGMVEARYIIYAPNRKKIDFEIISMLAGQVEGTINLEKSR
ncbi:MAG: hypothetical protein H8D56_14745 [Planctomycetes bacterium]|nr:hypothetical protein [Planctomycetota bacterium]MBL7143531.1 hypothetical protein [Phycisphaerae bacterium]